MKKITTLFKKDPDDLSRVLPIVDPANQWVLDGEGIATRKWDGTAAAVINGILYKRYDVKRGREVPARAIPCQDPDEVTGHWPHWVPCVEGTPEDKYFWKAYPAGGLLDGTYELVGPKINGNKQGLSHHELVLHGNYELDLQDRTYIGLKQYLQITHIEGIVFHHPDGRMCKIRRKDFGFKW